MAFVDEESLAGYKVLQLLGHGANSTIYAVQNLKDSQVLALKRVVKGGPNDQRFIDQMVNEFKISTQIDHPNIRRCYEIKKKRSLFTVQEVYLVMEMVEGKNLVEKRPSALSDLVKVFIVVADALMAMHRAGFVHADMKPNNIMVGDQLSVKVIDLGQSCRAGIIKTRIQGTPDYIAPEQVKRRPLTAQTDMFNFGATMYWCLTDRHVPTLIPKDDEDKQDRKLLPASEVNPKLPYALNAVIMDCLRTRPFNRPESFEDIHARLRLSLLQLDREQPVIAQPDA